MRNAVGNASSFYKLACKERPNVWLRMKVFQFQENAKTADVLREKHILHQIYVYILYQIFMITNIF